MASRSRRSTAGKTSEELSRERKEKAAQDKQRREALAETFEVKYSFEGAVDCIPIPKLSISPAINRKNHHPSSVIFPLAEQHGDGKEYSLCTLCVDTGREISSSFLSKKLGTKGGGNWAQHLRDYHDSKNHVSEENGYTYQRIVEWKGMVVMVNRSDREKNKVEKNLKQQPLEPETPQIKQARMCAELKLSFKVLEKDVFRDVLKSARESSTLEENFTSAATASRNVRGLFKEQLNSTKKKLQGLTEGQKVFIGSDGWDSTKRKFTGSFIAYVTEHNGELSYHQHPLRLTRNEVDKEGQIQSDEILCATLKEHVASVNLKQDDLGGSKTDNAGNGVSRKLMGSRTCLKQRHPTPGVLFMEQDEKALQGCISHNIALVGSYAMGNQESAGKSGIPHSPPPDVIRVLHEVQTTSINASTSKNYSSIQQVANLLGRSFQKPGKANDTRAWWGMMKLMRAFIVNGDLYNRTFHTNFLAPADYELVQEIHAIARPTMDISLAFTQRSSRPAGFATLPMIFCLFIEYGCRLENGLAGQSAEDILPDDDSKADLEFEVLQANGKYVIKRLSDFTMYGQQFFETWVAHLVYRLHTARANSTSFWEIISMFADPWLTRYAKTICQEEGDWSFEIMNKVAEESLKNLAPPKIEVVATSRKSAPEQAADYVPKRPRVMAIRDEDDEEEKEGEEKRSMVTESINSFHRAAKKISPIGGVDVKDLKSLGLRRFLQFFEKYDPLKFWSSVDHLVFTSPRLKQMNKTTLAYIASTSFQESIFSVAKRALTPERNALADATFEAIVMLDVKRGNRELIRKPHYPEVKIAEAGGGRRDNEVEMELVIDEVFRPDDEECEEEKIEEEAWSNSDEKKQVEFMM